MVCGGIAFELLRIIPELWSALVGWSWNRGCITVVFWACTPCIPVICIVVTFPPFEPKKAMLLKRLSVCPCWRSGLACNNHIIATISLVHHRRPTLSVHTRDWEVDFFLHNNVTHLCLVTPLPTRIRCGHSSLLRSGFPPPHTFCLFSFLYTTIPASVRVKKIFIQVFRGQQFYKSFCKFDPTPIDKAIPQLSYY